MTEPVEIYSLAHGGRGIARSEGRVLFVEGAVPGDVVTVEITKDKKRFGLATVSSVVRASPDRIEPPCPVFDRCGGCDWQMLDLGAQRRWKAEIVSGQLSHLGGVGAPPVVDTVAAGEGFGYRNRIDLRISKGLPALFAAGSHTPVVIEDCPLVVPPITEMIQELDPEPDVDRVTLRASERTGEKVMLSRRSGRWEDGQIHESVGGHVLRVSGRAFFQVNTPGAETLVRLVADALQPTASDSFLDGYAGGGLFSVTVGSSAGSVVAVESDRRALADLAVNAPGVQVVATPFEESGSEVPPVDLAVVDPPRAGLGSAGVAALIQADPSRLAYVSCDPASLGRDARLLIEAGYSLESVTPVDMFPQTHHVEAVAVYTR